MVKLSYCMEIHYIYKTQQNRNNLSGNFPKVVGSLNEHILK